MMMRGSWRRAGLAVGLLILVIVAGSSTRFLSRPPSGSSQSRGANAARKTV